MIALLDSPFEFSDTDMHASLERVCREVDDRDAAEADVDVVRSTVWIECTGEVVDAGSVKTVGVHKSGLDVEIVEFMCPRCSERHESLRFR